MSFAHDTALAMGSKPVRVEPPEGLHDNNDVVREQGIDCFEGRIATFPLAHCSRAHFPTWVRTSQRTANALRGPCAQRAHCSSRRKYGHGCFESTVV